MTISHNMRNFCHNDRKHMGCKRWREPINENMIIVFLRLNTLLVLVRQI